jgi:hypothetical protein
VERNIVNNLLERIQYIAAGCLKGGIAELDGIAVALQWLPILALISHIF